MSRTIPQSGWWQNTGAPTAQRPVGTPAHPPVKNAAAPFWALMVFTFVLLLSPQSLIPALAPLHIAFVAAALAAGLYLMQGFARRSSVARDGREVRIAACLVAWAVVTLPLSIWPGGSIAFLFGIYLKALVIFWLLASIVDSIGKLRIVAWGLSLMALPLSASAIMSFFSGGFQTEELSRGLDRIMGYDAPLSGNPNDLALMLNLILPLTIALFLGSRNLAVRMLLAAFACMDVVAIIASYSRGGFLVLGVIGAVYLFRMYRRGRRGAALILAVLMLVSVPLLPSSYLGRLSTIVDIHADQTNSAQVRLGDSIAAASYIVRHPIAGAGIGNNILALNATRGTTWTMVHNVYLVYAVELGLPGLALFLLLLKACLNSARDARCAAEDNPELAELFPLAEALGVSLLAFAVAGFFYPDAYQFYFYYFAGLAVASKSIAARVAVPVAPRLPAFEAGWSASP